MTITDLVEFSLKDTSNELKTIVLSVISPELDAKIFTETGVSFLFFEIVLDNYGIKHSMNGHGNKILEQKRGQIEITVSDFVNISNLIQNAAVIRIDVRHPNSPTPRKSLIFQRIENEIVYFIAFEIRQISKRCKTNRLVFQTIYKKKRIIHSE